MAIRFAHASRQHARHWPQHAPLEWDEFIAWLALDHPASTKDCGGYVLGLIEKTTRQHYLPGTRTPDGEPCTGRHRVKGSIASRSGIALDADSIDPATAFLADVVMTLDCALVVYTTFNHTPEHPRYRIVAPLDRDATADEYVLIMKAIMTDLGEENFDPTCSQAERLMHRPSAKDDGENYAYHVFPGEPLQASVWLSRAEELGLSVEPPRERYKDTSEPRAEEEGLHPEAASGIARQLSRLIDCELEGWEGPGWDDTTFQVACELVEYANSAWTGYSLDAAEQDLYKHAPTDEGFTHEHHEDKWRSACNKVDGGGKPLTLSAAEEFAALPIADVDVTNEAQALRWLRGEIGTNALSGVFRRDGRAVRTSRIGEEGYIVPKTDADDDGPAQVVVVTPNGLAARIDEMYNVAARVRKANRRSLFPREVALRVLELADTVPNLRSLRGMTHTPILRFDGSVLDEPGYDPGSGLLYLPQASLPVPHVPERPSNGELGKACALILEMIEEFPWVTPHDLANYLGALFTPLLRQIVPPPYKLIAIGAPQRGSGKSLLASLLRIIHGGVFKSEFPSDNDELRKMITSTLLSTSAPVVQFDNVAGTLRSSVLDGLLTSSTWSDRILAKNDMTTLTNDRMWVITGNNVKIGGDLTRRTQWITINANVPNPELRSGFHISDLEAWCRYRRGDLIHALLTVVRSWVVAGRPMDARPTSDSFGLWTATLRGILEHAPFGETVGVVGHEDSVRIGADEDEDEWGNFLAAVHSTYGDESWAVKDLLEKARWTEGEGLSLDDLPGDVAERLGRSETLAARSLGKYLSHREQRWARGLSISFASSANSRIRLWKVVTA